MMFNKKGMLLNVLRNLILVVIVFFTIFAAENKYLNVQNVNSLKEIKKVDLLLEGFQSLDNDFEFNYGLINYSLSVKDDVIYMKDSTGKKFKYKFNKYYDFNIDCDVEYSRVEDKNGYIQEHVPFLVFKKEGNTISCFDDSK